MIPLEANILPPGIRARILPDINGLSMHILESGTPGQPLVLLLHGFPELAWSWRKILPALARAGYHAVAPDQRGYGRTTGWVADYDGDLAPYRMANLARDAFGLVRALGYSEAACVVGHDFGASVAAWSALIRPDIYRSVVLMSAPFTGPPALPAKPAPDIDTALAALARPRKHYQRYYSTRPANTDMLNAPQGLPAFLRAYYHHKSADWPGNQPFPLSGWTAEELAKMPTYYVMDLAQDMAETVAAEMPSPAEIAANRWLTDPELAIYASEFARGFQGALNWYRCRFEPRFTAEQQLYAGRTIDIPALFIAGRQDWGIEQTPGALARMRNHAFTDMPAPILIDGAGHWVQQEQPQAVTAALLAFLARLPPR